MKLTNEGKQVAYGVANGSSYWKPINSGKKWHYEKAKMFWPFKNCSQATSAARRIVGGRVVRRVTWVTYEYDE